MNIKGLGANWLAALAVIGFVMCNGTNAFAQSFSAGLTSVPQDGAAAVPAGRLHVSGGKVRLETPDLADGFFLVDASVPSAYFVRPSTRTFMDAKQSSRLIQWFVPVDPDNPCPSWQAMAKLAGMVVTDEWRCERMGGEAIGNASTIRYRVVISPGHEIAGWIDAARKFPLRIRTEDGSLMTADHIRDEPQPADMFEIAAGFRKFDPQKLIERIKQSDVWVAGEKDSESSSR